ncbi:transposase [Aerosakkonemataceae cyanobacterium BLCC-F50]|uniref:Transposase n=1 Tax=Floridaenema flaviceps BLCC-F50 TaxID=3153642 RepID=A0ABV4XTA9_9CYAN
MYEYRKLTPEQKAELVEQRLKRGFPPHSPPHQVRNRSLYLLTSACYEHKCHLNSEARRQQLLDTIFEKFITNDIEILAWVILPNHYHLLVHLTNFDVLSELFRLIHGATSRKWNLEENLTGRKIWCKWHDRAIRSERHYYTTLNYIHYNPVKHNWVNSPYNWVHSSVHWYFQEYGRQWLRDAWVEYPVRDYGIDWDK